MKELCVYHHLGLGDHFDLNGMIRYYLKNGWDKVHVFAKSNYSHMIEYMYRDNKDIIVVTIDNNHSEISQVMEYYKLSSCETLQEIGFSKYPFNQEHLYDKNCWEFFYEQVNIPYNVHTEMFYVERDKEAENKLMKE